MLHQRHAAALQQSFGEGNVPGPILARCEAWCEAMNLITGNDAMVPAEVLALILADWAADQKPPPEAEPPVPSEFAFSQPPAETNGQPERPLMPSWAAEEQSTDNRDAISFEGASQVRDDGEHFLSRPFQHSPEPQPLTPERLAELSSSGQSVPVTFQHPRNKSLATGRLVGQEGNLAVVRTHAINDKGESFIESVSVAPSDIRL